MDCKMFCFLFFCWFFCDFGSESKRDGVIFLLSLLAGSVINVGGDFLPVIDMQTIESLEELKGISEPLHLALGVFDGVHIGHQAVISVAVEAARKHGGMAGVLTFEPHPIRVLAPEKAPRRILASIQHKKDLLEDLGVDVLIVIRFTPEFASWGAREFLRALKNSAEHLKTLTMGEDWKFGAKRSGNLEVLQEFGEEYGVDVCAAGSVRLAGERVSSTRIRQAIRDGNLEAASDMLGRPYTVWGTVVTGRKLGRTIGFPTANLRVYNEQLPPDGVWVVEVVLDHGKIYRGAGNLGVRPTVEGEGAEKLLEIYLLDFSGDLYGREMEVRFLAFVRGEQKFSSLDVLKEQILKDVTFCRNYSVK